MLSQECVQYEKSVDVCLRLDLTLKVNFLLLQVLSSSSQIGIVSAALINFVLGVYCEQAILFSKVDLY